MPTIRGRSVGWADGVVALGVASILFALSAPTLRERERRNRLEDAATAIESLRLTAEEHLDRTGAWPAGPDTPGEAPPALLTALHPEGTDGETMDFVLGWRPMEVVDSAEVPAPAETENAVFGDAPPPTDAEQAMRPVVRLVGSITVTSRDSLLLAGLLDRYGQERSFVRDSTWMLVLPRRGAGS